MIIQIPQVLFSFYFVSLYSEQKRLQLFPIVRVDVWTILILPFCIRQDGKLVDFCHSRFILKHRFSFASLTPYTFLFIPSKYFPIYRNIFLCKH